MTLAEIFRENLKAEMAAADLTQADLASMAGVSVLTVKRILYGKATPTLPVCEMLAHAMACDPAELFRVRVIDPA